MSLAETCPAGHPAEGYPRLRPVCCNPFAAFPRVGAWAPALPPKTPEAPGSITSAGGQPLTAPA